MPDKEPRKIGPVQDWERALRAKLSWPRQLKLPAFLKNDRTVKILLLLTLSLSIAFLLSPQPQKPWRQYKVKDIAQDNIRAVGDFLVEDVETTKKRQQLLLTKIPPVFDLDEQLAGKIQARLNRALEYMRQVSRSLAPVESGEQAKKPSPGKSGFTPPYKELLKHKPEFDRLLGVPLPTTSFRLLAKAKFSPAVEALVNQVIQQVSHQGVIASRSFPQPEPKMILVRRLPSGKEQVLRTPYPFLVLNGLRKPVANYCREIAADFSAADRFLVCDLVQHLSVSSLSFNLAETRERQQIGLNQLLPTFYPVKKGEFLLREGERLTPLHLAKLRAQSASYPPHRGLLIFLGTFLSLVLILWLVYNLAHISLRNFSTRLKDLAFLAALILVSLIINKSIISLSVILTPLRPELGQNLVYALPIALAPLCATLFLGMETGLALAFLMAILSALLLEKPFPLFLYLVAASLMGVWGLRSYGQRRSLINTGLAICAVNLFLVTAFKFVEYPFTARDLLLGQCFALSGGLLTGILALGLTPILESVFRYTSNIRLLEMLNLDQPLLKELMLVAPGTYHHSLIVGQIVEVTASAIGANPLLAKAAAYYHDIGKVKKPAYFVENQFGGENKHEKLAPSMSSLILTAHVKDGVELARKHRLGEAICAIIQQHHGTCFISYFYDKAQNQASNPSKVNANDYRYPGPRPQTKEAGLVLVADQVEAASKTLSDPTPARVQGMVQKIINKIFADGQLDQCELTLKELHLIAKHCNKILSGMFHQRVQYPAPAAKTRSHEDLDKQPTKKNGVKSANGKEKSQEDLKRLGMG